MRRLLVVLALVGCDLGTDLDFENRRPLDPPAEYRALYAAVEACRRMHGDFDRVRWFVADEVFRDGEPAGAVIDFPDTITMRFDVVADHVRARHEMDHHVTQVGDALHLEDGGTECDGEH